MAVQASHLTTILDEDSSDSDGGVLLNQESKVSSLHYQYEDSDSDSGVLLNPKSKTATSQRKADIEFTFSVPVPGTISFVNTSIFHFQVQDHSSHNHDMSTCDVSPVENARYCISPVHLDPVVSQSEKCTASVEDIAEALDEATLSEKSYTSDGSDQSYTSGKSGLEISNREVRRILRKLEKTKFGQTSGELAESDLLPDFNIGWNRARYQLGVSLNNGHGEIDERKTIHEAFERFSWTRQQHPIVLSEEVYNCMAERLFVGCRCDKTAWSRAPGSWWATRKSLFAVRGREPVIYGVNKTVRAIQRKVYTWWKEMEEMSEIDAGELSLKREHSTFMDEGAEGAEKTDVDILGPAGKRVKMLGRKSEEVMSEVWRERRRLQEKKAGRWTDGTLRMERLWAPFHWVLNVEDPGDVKWE